MKSNFIITFARQFGSGGHDVAKKTAEILGVPFYDKEIIAIAAKESGLSEHLFDGLEEKPTNSLLYSLVMGLQSGAPTYCRFGDMTGTDNVFRIQTQIIKELASKGSCVMVGRCTDYVLREYENLVSVFVHADAEHRISVIMKRCGLKEGAAEDYMNKMDKRRSSFYNFYTNRIWGSVDNYDLSIDTARLGIDGAAEIVAEYVKRM